MNRCSSINQQRGSSLVEAIIALILLSIVAKGALYLSSRASASQGESRLQEITLSQMRAQLMNNNNGAVDICTNAPIVALPNGVNLQTQVQGCGAVVDAYVQPVNAAASITINNIPAPLTLSVTDSSIGGQMVVGGTWDP